MPGHGSGDFSARRSLGAAPYGVEKPDADYCRLYLDNFSGETQILAVQQTKQQWNSVLWIEAFGFSVIIALSWLTEAVRIPHFIFGESFTPNWHRAALRTIVMLLIWGWVHVATNRMLKRLHYLEDFLRICGWCRKVCYNGEWLTMEEFFSSKFATQTTHGMCPECLNKGMTDLSAKQATPEISAAEKNSPEKPGH
jgi:hypothetical protein